MPWTRFACPDGVEIRIEDCIENCRMSITAFGHTVPWRCCSRPTLMLLGKGRREWDGKISATQALNGTRQEYLKLTTDYAEAPCSRAFALLGTLHHLTLQGVEVPNAIQEEQLEDELGTGKFDFLDKETHELTDFKTAGAYKVNRLLGKIQTEVETGEFYKVGPKKGLPKTTKVWQMGEPDDFEYRMQLSRYCWMLRDRGDRVDRCLLQITVRDYTKRTGQQYGLDRQIYLVEITPFPREVVVDYYRTKGDALRYAMDFQELPPVCSPEERWEDNRCRDYCPVWASCPHGRQVRAEPLPNGAAEEGAA